MRLSLTPQPGPIPPPPHREDAALQVGLERRPQPDVEGARPGEPADVALPQEPGAADGAGVGGAGSGGEGAAMCVLRRAVLCETHVGSVVGTRSGGDTARPPVPLSSISALRYDAGRGP